MRSPPCSQLQRNRAFLRMSLVYLHVGCPPSPEKTSIGVCVLTGPRPRPRLARIGDQAVVPIVPPKGFGPGLPQSVLAQQLLLGTATFEPGNVR